ncbi:hypothetical protein ACMXYX_04785 [Neptuniibacter sp. QD72_48]|uniref:hypothetical protein n=1 Tax=unclassified Neptuniibacter TaxID=2630693 RepID=UPI0039F47384
MTDQHYSETAYNSNNIPETGPSELKQTVFRKFKLANADRLNFNQISGQVPYSLSEEIELDDYKDRKMASPWDHQTYTKGKANFGLALFYFIGVSTETFLKFFLPVTVVGFILMYSGLYFDGNHNDPEALLTLKILLYFFCLFFGSSALFQLYYHKIAGRNGKVPFFMKIRKDYELSRQTGMVHIYKKDKEVFAAPFHEFDCYLASNPGNYGEIFYTMRLIHRYNGSKHTVDLGALLGFTAPIEEYYQLWNMMQQYMDISRPMPDNIMSEAYRHLDPTTAAYDQETGRDSHFWRNMNEEQYQAELKRRAKEQQSIPLQAEDILRWKKPDEPFVA